MKNIVLITADSLRADHCSTYGYEKETTPMISNLGGAKFSNASANAPTTILSIPSILSGKYPLENGHPAANYPNTLLSEFEDTDYATGIFTSNIQLSRFNYEEKFDTAEFLMNNLGEENDSNPIIRAARWALRQGGIFGPLSIIAKERYLKYTGPLYRIPTDEEIFQTASEWIDVVSEPYFLWLHLMDTHNPFYFEREDFEAVSDSDYDPSRFAQLQERALTDVRSGDFRWTLSEEQKQYLIDSYDASIRHVDSLIGEFANELDLSETSVIVSSDHGEEFWEHGYYGHAGRKSYPRKMTLYQEMLHVPLLLLGDEFPDTTISTPVSLVDLYPTITDMASVNLEDESHHGDSLLPVGIEEKKLDSNRDIVAQVCSPAEPSVYTTTQERHHLASIRRGNTKYIFNEHQEDEFYHLVDDSGETNNKISEMPNDITIPRRKLRRLMNSGDQSTEVDANEDLKNSLRDLGYLE